MMERLLQHPTWLKVFSVALAIMIWVMVMPKYTVPDTALFELPLHVHYHPEFQLDEGPKDMERFVTVRVDGQNLVVSRVRADMLRADVDYSKITEPGKPTDVEVQVTGPANLKGLTYSVQPRTVTVTVIKTQEATIPVTLANPSQTVTVGDREWVYSAKLETDEIKLVGRSDLLAQVTAAQVVLDANDLKPGTARIVKNVTLTGKSVEKLTVPQVGVVFTWVEQPPGKAFKVTAATKGTLPAGVALGSIDVQPATMLVRASALGSKLPDQAVISTEPIDLTGKTKSFSVDVKVVPPPGTKVTIDTVRATVNLAEAITEKVIKGVPLSVHGKPVNADVATSITDVQVHVRGPYSQIQTFDASQLTVYADVEGLTTGKHTVPVKVTAPPAITVVDTDPITVDVTMTPSP